MTVRISLASGKTAINRNTHGIIICLSSLENDVQLLRIPKTLQPMLPLQRPNEPIQYTTCAALPETGSRVDDLYSRQDQTTEFAMISFHNPPPVEGGELVVCPAGAFLVSSLRLQENSGRGKMVLIAVEAVPTGSKPPATVSVRVSTSERHGSGASAPSSTMAHPYNEGEREVRWSYHRSWSDTSGRDRPSSQNSYPHASLELLQRPPYACES